MSGSPKDPTNGLFDLNGDGELDGAEYSLLNEILSHEDDDDDDNDNDEDDDDSF